MPDVVDLARGPGRSLRWRGFVIATGAVIGAVGLGIVVWPSLLAYAVGGVFLAAGLGLVVTAVAARGR